MMSLILCAIKGYTERQPLGLLSPLSLSTVSEFLYLESWLYTETGMLWRNHMLSNVMGSFIVDTTLAWPVIGNFSISLGKWLLYSFKCSSPKMERQFR
jgi:hypothetical protein